MILSIMQDQGIATAVSALSYEASIPILGVSDLRNILAGNVGQHEAFR